MITTMFNSYCSADTFHKKYHNSTSIYEYVWHLIHEKYPDFIIFEKVYLQLSLTRSSGDRLLSQSQVLSVQESGSKHVTVKIVVGV